MLEFALVLGFQSPALYCEYKEPQACIEQQMFDLTEAVIARIESHGTIRYRSGCDGTAPCRSDSFDCSGIITDARRYVGFYDERKLDSSAVYAAGQPVELKETKRGDYLFFEPLQEGTQRHIAIVTRGYDSETRTIEILDYAINNTAAYRELNVRSNGGRLGKYRLHASRVDYTSEISISRTTGKMVVL